MVCGELGVASLTPAQKSNVRVAALPVCFPQGLPPSERALEPPQAAGLEMAASCPPPVRCPRLLPTQAPVLPRVGPSCCDLRWSAYP